MSTIINIPSPPDASALEAARIKYSCEVVAESEFALTTFIRLGHQRILLPTTRPITEDQLPSGGHTLEAPEAAAHVEKLIDGLATLDPPLAVSPPPTSALTSLPPETRDAHIFSQDQWKALLSETWADIGALATSKGEEYSGDVDRLANFRRAAADYGTPIETVWGIYAGKHWDAVQTYINDLQIGRARKRSEPIVGRVDDLLVYLLLFKAMLKERGEA
jgi:hypothetical protein